MDTNKQSDAPRPTDLDPTYYLTRQPRDGNEADRLRRESRREVAVLPPPEPTSMQLAHRWGVPVGLIEYIDSFHFARRLSQLEADAEALKNRVEILEAANGA